ncbi:hypothetical protein Tco_1571718 [Tanacetum coccineum]
MPRSHTQNHRIFPSKSVNARRAADHNRKLNVVDHNQFVIRSLKSVNHTKKVWKATRNHNVKPQWKPTGRHFALYDNCPLTRIMKPIVEPLELTPSVSYSSKVTMISRFTDCKLSDQKAGSKGISVISDCNPDLTQRLNVRFSALFLPQPRSCLRPEHFSHKQSFGCTVADYIAERLKRPTAYKFRQIAVSLLSRNL